MDSKLSKSGSDADFQRTLKGINSAVFYTPGRKPWFDLEATSASSSNGNAASSSADTAHDISAPPLQIRSSSAMIIGIAGGSASGKTTLANLIIKNLDVPWVVSLAMDSFYKPLTKEQIDAAYRNEYNFDDPNAFDFDLLLDTLQKLKEGKSVKVPVYCFKTHSRLSVTKHLYGASVVIFEGIYGLYDSRIVDMMDMKIFVDTDDDIRLCRRLKRDIAERGRDLNGVLLQYMRFVKPSFDQWIRPTMRAADVIVPRGADNTVAVELITKHIAYQLDERGFSIRSKLAQLPHYGTSNSGTLSQNVTVMTMTPQLKFVHTRIRDRDCPQEDFVFYTERLSRLLVETALNLLPYEKKIITTPTGATYEGLQRTDNLCGVSIIRSGLTMEKPLRKVCPYIAIGKLLIQSSIESHEPCLHYAHLPSDVAKRHVLLMDSSISTGASMMMAIRVLLEHGVLEENIIVMCLIAHPLGLFSVSSAFPKLRIVVSEVDSELDSSNYYILPGMGNIGDRYFGTC